MRQIGMLPTNPTPANVRDASLINISRIGSMPRQDMRRRSQERAEMGKDIAQEKAHFGAPRMWPCTSCNGVTDGKTNETIFFPLLHAFLNSMLLIGN